MLPGVMIWISAFGKFFSLTVGSRVAVSCGVGCVSTIGGMDVPSRVLITIVGPDGIFVGVAVMDKTVAAGAGVVPSRVAVCMGVITGAVPVLGAQPEITIMKIKQTITCVMIGFNLISSNNNL